MTEGGRYDKINQIDNKINKNNKGQERTINKKRRRTMEKSRYRRDLPDGSRQYFHDRIERPDAEQIYFDDMISGNQSDGQEPLEFLFFGREQSYPRRSLRRNSDAYILHYVTRGKGIFNGKSVGAGEGFLVVPDVPHHMEADSEDPWHFKWVCFRGRDAMRQMKGLGLDDGNPFFRFGFTEQLEELFEDVLYRDHGNCDWNTYMQGAFYILLSYHKKECEDGRRKNGGYAEEAIRYIDLHYRENIRAEEIAEALHISRKYLCVVLEKHIGMSTKEYLLSKRVEEASELLLQTKMTVSDIAAEVGYTDYTQFSRLFRKKKGRSPQQFRKQSQDPTADLTE